MDLQGATALQSAHRPGFTCVYSCLGIVALGTGCTSVYIYTSNTIYVGIAGDTAAGICRGTNTASTSISSNSSSSSCGCQETSWHVQKHKKRHGRSFKPPLPHLQAPLKSWSATVALPVPAYVHVHTYIHIIYT